MLRLFRRLFGLGSFLLVTSSIQSWIEGRREGVARGRGGTGAGKMVDIVQ